MFCNMIKKALEETEKQEEDSKKCFSHSNTAISIQNGASTFQPKQNGTFSNTRIINYFILILYCGEFYFNAALTVK